MNWFEKTEQKRNLLISGIIILCLAMLIVTVRRNNVSYDSYWHLKMGLDWLQNNSSLWLDHFSFTFFGKEISGPPYLFQVFLGWLVTQFGLYTGLEAFKLISFLLTFTLVTIFLKQLRSPAIIYCMVLPIIVVLLQMRSIVRPELISYSFSILALILYYRANKTISTINMLSIALLMLFWSNYHSSIFGYIIFFGFFTDLAILQVKQRATIGIWLKWLIWGLVIVAVGFLQPGFHHPIIGAFSFSPEWKNLILEYQSALLYWKVPAMYSLIALYVVTLVLLVRKRQIGLIFICLLLGYNSLNMSRLVTPSGIVILCIFAWAMSEVDIRARLQSMSQGTSRIAGAVITLIFIISLGSSVYIARSYMKENRIATLFPEDIVNYMVNHGIKGRIFNSYGIGGYLIYRLSPESQVYIDGRTGILYTLNHYYDHLNSLRSAEMLRAEINKYDIQLAILKNEPRYYSLAHDTGVLGLDYVGNRYTLFRKNNPNFPVIGTLLASPACWNPGMTPDLESEQAKAAEILPPNSFLQPSLIQFMLDYSHSDDKMVFLNSLEVNDEWSSLKLRFAAYQALAANLNSLAYDLFMEIAEPEFSDRLAVAVAQTRMGEWEKGEQNLDELTRKSASFKASELRILHDLLVQIRQNFKLQYFDDAYIERIGKESGPDSGDAVVEIPDIRAFCPEIQGSN